MTDKKKTTQPEPTSEAQNQKQTQDFPNIPAASENQNPPDIDKEDIKNSKKINDDYKTDNEEEH